MRSLAYLDAGSVSMVASAIVAGVAGIAVVMKMGFRRFLGVFSKKQKATFDAEQAARAEAKAAAEAAKAAAGK